MPIYFYECKECNERFDFLHIKSDDEPMCPRCACEDLLKLPTTHAAEIFNFPNVPV